MLRVQIGERSSRHGQPAGQPPGSRPRPSWLPRRGLSVQGCPDRLQAPHRILRRVGPRARGDRRSDGRRRAGLAPPDPFLLGRLTKSQTTARQPKNNRRRRTTEEQSNTPLPRRPTARRGPVVSFIGRALWRRASLSLNPRRSLRRFRNLRDERSAIRHRRQRATGAWSSVASRCRRPAMVARPGSGGCSARQPLPAPTRQEPMTPCTADPASPRRSCLS